MQLVESANKWYKMFSVWVFVAIAFLTCIYEQWESVFAPILPADWLPYIVAALALLGVVARLIDQGIQCDAESQGETDA